jgi:hypothetical protein
VHVERQYRASERHGVEPQIISQEHHMSERLSQSVAQRAYTPPAITRVYIDPVRELLLQTGCLFGPNDPGVCQTNPCGLVKGGP